MENKKQIEDLKNDIESLFDEIEEISLLGDNSVVRRIKNSLYNTFDPYRDNLNLKIQENNRRCDHKKSILEFSEVLQEYKEDDRRRSIFIDPEESIMANLSDYYSGRLKSIEIRNHNNTVDFEDLKKRTLEYMKGKYPAISINHDLVQDDEELIFLLRQLEKDIQDNKKILSKENCSNRTEIFGTRWSNNGRKLERGIKIIRKCCKKDPCCGNETCNEKVIKNAWEVVWEDGNSSTPPPTTPGNYTPEDWDNRLPFFDSDSNAQLVSDWGWRNLNGKNDFHGGIDLALPAGSIVNSVNSGEIVHIGTNGHKSGVVIRNGNHLYGYWHVSPSINLSVGDNVTNGTYLGNIANGGREHLHYSIHNPPNGDWAQRNDGNSENPLP